jgi:integrase/recombinase XerC
MTRTSAKTRAHRGPTVKIIDPPPVGAVEVTLEEMIRRHLDDMQVRGLRTQSIYNRRRALARFTAWMGGPILYATPEQLHTWQVQRSREISLASRAAELSNVREFYRWCYRKHFLSADPTAELDLPRVPRRVPRPMPDEALAYAMSAALPHMAAMLGLAAFAGLRACEIARLDWSEVDLRGDPPMVCVVDGKGGRGRVVPLAVPMIELLDALPKRAGAVIPRGDGSAEPCAPHRISARVNDFLHGIGVEESLHQLRHRFATSTYRACRDLRAVQELLGHASPVTTAGYAAASGEVAEQAVEAASTLRPHRR